VRKHKIRYDKLPTQAKVFDDDTTKTIIQSMGLGGGKTYNLCMKTIKLSKLNRGMAGGILAPTLADFKRDILPTMEDICEENNIPLIYRDNGKRGKFFQFPWNKKPTYIFSAERPIAGPNLAYCLINEFSLIQYVRINEMMRRVRIKGAPALQKILVGTPEDIHGWLEEFVENQEKIEAEKPGSFKIHYGGSGENIHIDEDYTEFLEQTLDEASLQIFRDGQIGRIGGDFFYYAFDRNKNVCASVVHDPNEHIWVGLDFNVGKMAITFSHKYGDEQHFFDEKFLLGDSDTEAAARYIKETYGAYPFTVICDASGNNRKTIANKDGLRQDVAILKKELGAGNVKYKSANTRLRKRQLQNAGMMHHGRIKIAPKCKKLIKDYMKTKQNPDYTKNEGKDHSLSHFSDGADYVIDWLHKFEINRPKQLSHSVGR
jgi:hypothetical protein